MLLRHLLFLVPLRLGIVALLLWQIARARKARRRTEAALAAVADSEARFHAFMNNSPLVGFIKDEAGRLVYLNQKFTDVFRKPVSDVIGKTEFGILPQDQALQIRRHDLRMLNGDESGEDVQSLPGPDGVLNKWLIIKFPFAAAGKKFLGGFAVNMSERERAEEALRESEQRFRTAFAHAAIGMAVTSPTGRILQVNPALCQILGYSAEEMLALDVFTITHPEDRQMTLEWQLRARGANADHVRYEKRCIRRDGAPVWTQISIGVVRNAHNEATHFIALVEDITRKKQAEQMARLSEERWHLALEATNDGIWDWDATTNTVYYSARWKEMLGFEECEVPNQSEIWERLVHPEDLARAKAAVEDHLNRKTPHYMAEYRIRCKDGSYKWVLARGKAIWDSDGKAIRMIGAHADITDRKRAEEKLFYQASFDSLTGLMNRRYFLSRLEKKILMARTNGQELSLCICDIDRFKSINDRYGHRAGDDVLVNFACILQETTRSSDLAGRLGGDEFCILLWGANPERAAECLERIRGRFQTIAFGSGNDGVFSATASFGIASLAPEMTSSTLIEVADRALYLAKQKGRNLVTALSEPIIPAVAARFQALHSMEF